MSKASILRCSAFFMVQLSRPNMTTGKTRALTGRTFISKVKSSIPHLWNVHLILQKKYIKWINTYREKKKKKKPSGGCGGLQPRLSCIPWEVWVPAQSWICPRHEALHPPRCESVLGVGCLRVGHGGSPDQEHLSRERRRSQEDAKPALCGREEQSPDL